MSDLRSKVHLPLWLMEFRFKIKLAFELLRLFVRVRHTSRYISNIIVLDLNYVSLSSALGR